ncbi:ABC transporter substrate binding protein [Catenovulum maritimum]|uniref:Diguanylate cyclase n=1 Tax=Catenovulum maritimum TaxID=1513271 RepID=A0A0J8GM14_9ALTE|nr:ABC transporter substrate binding protein [Catenovulum maritimum]KMT63835.1 hypothetical protein XM47_17650 [Catenovulum maritimum]
MFRQLGLLINSGQSILVNLSKATILSLCFTFQVLTQENIEILSIHSYHEDFPWTKNQFDSFKSGLAKARPDIQFNYSTEYLNTKKITPTPELSLRIIQYLEEKYANHLPDLIYLTDDYAAEIIVKNEIDFIKDIPVVFSGVNNEQIIVQAKHNKTTGVIEKQGIKQSIQLINLISPKAKDILLIGDDSVTDQVNSAAVQRYNSQHINHSKITHISIQRLGSLLAVLDEYQNLPVIIGSVGAIKDDDDILVNIHQLLSVLRPRYPIIVLNGNFEIGALAGYHLEAVYGEGAANLAINILKGASEQNKYPIPLSTKKRLVIDYQVAEKLKVDLSNDFFNSAIVLNQPSSFYQKHHSKISFFSIVFGIMFFVFSLGLIVLLRHRNNIIHQQFTDTLTKLPNRTKLVEDLKKQSSCCLVLLDINNFRTVNAFYGSDIGDQLLCNVSLWLQQNIKATFNLYRISGDNFALIVPAGTPLEALTKEIENLLFMVEQVEFLPETIAINVTFTAGISHHVSAEKINQAHSALLFAKKHNSPISTHNDNQIEQKKKQQNLEWHHKLKQAINDNRITAYFQPIICNKTGKIACYEALIRLIDTKGNVVGPFFFLEVAKQSRLYHKLTHIVFHRALEFVREENTLVSINISQLDVANNQFENLLTTLKQSQLADKVGFEITETEEIENHKEFSAIIKNLQALGSEIAIDDFGTGYSNFGHILDLQANKLKVDGSLIQRILIDKKAELVVQTIIESAQNLGMKTVAEFVDSAALYEKVKSMGFDYSQGYYLAEPKSAEDWLQTSSY